MKQPVVFIVARDPRKGRGGHASYVRAHALAARRAGYEPHIFCAASESLIVETDFGTVHAVKTDFLPQRTLEAGLRKKILPWTAPFVTAAIIRFLSSSPGPHLIHGFSTWGSSGFAAAEKLRRMGISTEFINSHYTTLQHEVEAKVRGLERSYGLVQRLLYEAELLWLRKVVRHHERITYTRPRLVLVNYDAVVRQFLTEHGPGAEMRRLPYASEAAFVDKPGEEIAVPSAIASLRPADAPLIVSVSRHDPRKGIPILLRALAALRDSGVRFRACLVSGGQYFEENKRMAEELRLGENVILTGWVPDPFPYLKAADVFVLPSTQEGSGSVSLLEALQAGAAIVASNLDGIPEDITNGENGVLVEPGSVEALTETLRLVVTDAVLRDRLRRQARATFEARFSADAFSNALRDVYAEMGFKANSQTR